MNTDQLRYKCTKTWIIYFSYPWFSWGIRWPNSWPMPRLDVILLSSYVVAWAAGLAMGRWIF